MPESAPIENTGEKKQEKVINPREKSGMGLDYWANSLFQQGRISEQELKDFVRENNRKEESMAEKNLPQLKHYGLFSSIAEIRERAPKDPKERFIIRCTLKETDEIKRLVDTDLDGACEFAEKLPGGIEKWKVELKEFTSTIAAGTIIVEASGKTIIETWKGAHYLNTTNCPKYNAEFDPTDIAQQSKFKWSEKDGNAIPQEMQGYAMDALRYFFPHLKPKQDDPIYAEYGVKPSGQIYFIEATNSPLLTGGITF